MTKYSLVGRQRRAIASYFQQGLQCGEFQKMFCASWKSALWGGDGSRRRILTSDEEFSRHYGTLLQSRFAASLPFYFVCFTRPT
ncbi:MAG: hypothetical protein GXY37_00205 [Chloroflexi bacterium]|nr:hypothetical protein [Chloroflexota bacterium]